MPAYRCDIDHTRAFDHTDPTRGGRTVRGNGACLCRRHHGVKTAGENGLNGWRVRQHPGGRLDWTTPTGATLTTYPDGAPDLWPTPDLHLPTPAYTPFDRDAYPDRIGGHHIATETELAAITAGVPYHSELEEWLDYLLDSHPKPPPTPARAGPAPLDEPAPF